MFVFERGREGEGERERGRERKRETDRQPDSQTDRQRQRIFLTLLLSNMEKEFLGGKNFVDTTQL